MAVIDFILNLAGLLLWLNWRSARFDPLQRTSASSLAGTLRRAEPSRSPRWFPLAGLLVLLFARALLYWQFGAAVNWTPKLHLGAIALSFRSDYLDRMLLYSLLSFGLAWLIFNLWLIVLSVINRKAGADDPIQKLVRWQLGRFERLPVSIRLLLPWMAAVCAWLALHPLLVHWSILPSEASWAKRLQQASLVTFGFYLSLRYVLGGILAVYLLGSYVYLGKHPFLDFISLTGRNLLRPFRALPFMALGKVDISPVIVLALIFLVVEFAERVLTLLYQRLAL